MGIKVKRLLLQLIYLSVKYFCAAAEILSRLLVDITTSNILPLSNFRFNLKEKDKSLENSGDTQKNK